MDVETVKKTIEKAGKGFIEKWARVPNTLVIPKVDWEVLLEDARKILRPRIGEGVTANDVEDAVKNICTYNGMKIIVVDAVQEIVVGYIEYGEDKKPEGKKQ